MKTGFKGLSLLVRVDVLAALPSDVLLKVARCGNTTLRQTCSLKWVMDRMIDDLNFMTDKLEYILFSTFVDAFLIGGDIEASFCKGSIMKRVRGFIDVQSIEQRRGTNTFGTTYLSIVGKLLKKVPGPLFVTWMTDDVADSELELYFNNAVVAPKVFYVWEFTTVQKPMPSLIGVASNLIFYYVIKESARFNLVYYPPKLHSVYYRPALLNGRHIIDVVRTVCKLGDHRDKEEELQRVRRDVTASAEEVEGYRGLWRASWSGYKIGWTSRFGDL